jgi:hypothetical protein
MKCRARTQKNRKCPYDAVLMGYCLRHYQLKCMAKNEQEPVAKSTILSNWKTT